MRAAVTPKGCPFFRSGRAVENGWHNNCPGSWRTFSPLVGSASSGTCFSELNPLRGTLLRKMSLSLHRKANSPLSESPRPRPHLAPIARQLHRCLRQVFGVQHVSAVDRRSAARADFLHLQSPSARIPAGKKILKISLAVDIRWPLPLGSGVGFHPPPSSSACSEGNRRMRFYSRRGGIPEAQRQVCVDGPWDINCHQDPASGRKQYGRSRRCPQAPYVPLA